DRTKRRQASALARVQPAGKILRGSASPLRRGRLRPYSRVGLQLRTLAAFLSLLVRRRGLAPLARTGVERNRSGRGIRPALPRSRQPEFPSCSRLLRESAGGGSGPLEGSARPRT